MNKPSSSQKKKAPSDYDATSARFFQNLGKDKVAESLAVYTPTRRRTSTSAPRRIAGITASEEVWRFAARNGLLAHLETAVRLAKECFKEIDQFGFSYDVDPEIENESWINIRARIKGTFDELLQEDLVYTHALARALPPDKQTFIRFFSNVECEG